MSIQRRFCAIIILISLCYAIPAFSAEKAKKPYPRYWMSIETNNMSMPGMGEMGDMRGLGGMFGGIGGPKRTLYLQLNSPHKASSDPNATHDIPPVMKMGDTLPLLIPPKERVTEVEGDENEYEKPRFRLRIYWGCSDKVRQGQPRIIDTDKMTIEEFSKAMSGRAPSRQYPPTPRSGWIYSEWPNEKKRMDVKKDSSLIGEHIIHGNYLPDTIKFKLGDRHDFMAPVEVASVKGDSLKGYKFSWKSIPTAIGYFASAMSNNEKTGEMILWTSSEVYDTGWGLMDYLSNDDVKRFIKEKVVMAPEVTSCEIPAGVFKDAGFAGVQFIAYGSELNLTQPPMPNDPKEREKWNPVWSVKVRLKSTSMIMLEEMERGHSSDKPEFIEEDEPIVESRPKAKSKDIADEESGKDSSPIKKLRGIFGF